MLGDAAAIEAVCDGAGATTPPAARGAGSGDGGEGRATLCWATRRSAALTRRLLPLAALITPNLPEAEALAGMTHRDVADDADVAAARCWRWACRRCC